MTTDERFWVLIGVFVFIIVGGSRLAITCVGYFIDHYDKDKPDDERKGT